MIGPQTIGALRHRLTLEAPIDVVDDLGGFTRSFAYVARVWARIETLGTSEQFVEQRMEQTGRHAVTIRWRADVRSGMRFVFRRRALLIRSVMDSDESQKFLTCLCEEFS